MFTSRHAWQQAPFIGQLVLLMRITPTSVERDIHTNNHHREYRLFWALDDDGDGDGLAQTSDLVHVLEQNGLTRKDPCLNDLFSALDNLETDTFDFSTFLNIIKSASALTEQVLQGDLALPDFAQF